MGVGNDGWGWHAAAHGRAVILYLARSKTDQEGEGSYCWLAPDTVRRVSAWLGARADALQAEK